MTEENIIPIQKENVKLSKMSKGYNWEIRLVGDDKINSDLIERLDKLNEQMKDKFGSSE